MVFASTISTPANQLKSDPLRTELKCNSGVAYQFRLYFPPGSLGLVGVAVYNANIAVYPASRGEFFIGDAVTITFPDLFELFIETNSLQIYTYNLDTHFDHECQVNIGVVSRPEFIEHFLPGRAMSGMEGVLENLTGLLGLSQPYPQNPGLIEVLADEGVDNGTA